MVKRNVKWINSLIHPKDVENFADFWDITVIKLKEGKQNGRIL